MVRDDDFIRDLLMEAEASNDPYILAPLVINPCDEDLKKHVHSTLLCDAGLFAEESEGVFRITNQGHDYLAAIRNDTVWKKTKAGALAVGGVTLGMMKDIALAYVKQEIIEKTGLHL